MLDLSYVAPAEHSTARVAEAYLVAGWRRPDSKRTVRLPHSELLAQIAATTVTPVRVKKPRWKGRMMRLTGDPIVLAGVFKLYLAMLLGSEKIG